MGILLFPQKCGKNYSEILKKRRCIKDWNVLKIYQWFAVRAMNQDKTPQIA